MRKLLSFLALSLCAAACIYPYTPDLEEAPEGVLSVDGSICIGETSTVYLGLLSSLWPSEPDDNFHTYLSDSPTQEVRVWVEDDQGGQYPGVSDIFGSYLGSFTIDTRNAPADRNYRLCINALGATYTSDWSDLAEPPVIKEVQFDADDYLVNVSVNLDGGVDGTGYMILNYDEASEFHVDYPLAYEVDPLTWKIMPLESPDYSRFWCWKSIRNNTNFLVDYSAMAEAGVSGYPLLSFPRTDNRNHRRYCVNVKARTLSPKTYRFLKNLQGLLPTVSRLGRCSPGVRNQNPIVHIIKVLVSKYRCREIRSGGRQRNCRARGSHKAPVLLRRTVRRIRAVSSISAGGRPACTSSRAYVRRASDGCRRAGRPPFSNAPDRGSSKW